MIQHLSIPAQSNRTQTSPRRALRVLALRAVDGAGGGADKIVLRNADSVSPASIEMAACFIHHPSDTDFDLVDRANQLGIRTYEETHRGPFDLRIFSGVQKVITDFQPDIVHSHDYKASFIASRLARRNPILCLATSHGWTGEKWREKNLFYPADRRLLSNFPGIIAVSDQIRDTLVTSGTDSRRVRVVLNGVDPHKYRRDLNTRSRIRKELGYAESDIVLGGVGRVELQKRFDLLIEAFAELRNQDNRLKLLIAGEGSLLEPLRTEVRRRKLDKHCRLIGHRENMTDTYQALDVLVQSSDYEGTPTVVVEAMALEIPIVATDAGGTAQLIQNQQHGRIVPCQNVPALIAATRETLESPTRSREMAMSARQRVETKLSFDERTRQLEAIYQELFKFGFLNSDRPLIP